MAKCFLGDVTFAMSTSSHLSVRLLLMAKRTSKGANAFQNYFFPGKCNGDERSVDCNQKSQGRAANK